MSQINKSKGLNADLENFELTDVMQLITQQVKCGILSVENSNSRCSWSFNEGYLVDFDCHFIEHDLDLKTILTGNGQIDEQRILALQEKGQLKNPHELEKELIQEGLISRSELEKTNLRRLIESFIITLQWTKGKYKFLPTSEIKRHDYFPPQDTNFIILEALRQIDEMAVMKKRLLPLERIFESTLVLNSDESSGKDDSLFQEGLESQFDQDELGVYKLLDGRRTLAEILNISRIGQFHTCRIILDFFDRGIITPRISARAQPANSKSLNSSNFAGTALIILSGAIMISFFIATGAHNRLKKERAPTFFSAIIDNLKAEQQSIKDQARKLLQN